MMPRPIVVQNLTKPLPKPARVGFCDSFLCRLRGLTFRPRLDPDDGLLLVERGDSRVATSIHMFFVSFDISAIWINSQMRVVDKVIARSWRPFYASKTDAQYTLEIHPDRFGDYEIGDLVEFKHV